MDSPAASPVLRICLCVKGYQRVLDLLRTALPLDDIVDCAPSEIATAAASADVLIPLITALPPASYASARLKLIQQYGVGLDVVDIPAATRAGILVANVPSVGSGNAESVAELAIAHLLMLSRQIPLALQRFRERRVGAPMGHALWQSTVLILGYGDIGQEIARRLAGWGCRVLAVSRHGPDGGRVRDPAVPLAAHVPLAGLASVIGAADSIIVCAPATPENLGLVDARMVAAMQRGVNLVNIARGQVIDYQALLDGLRSGQIGGAGLDVFWQEPFDPDDPLFEHNVIATPHVGGVTVHSLVGIARAVAANVEALRRGEIPVSCVNPGARR